MDRILECINIRLPLILKVFVLFSVTVMFCFLGKEKHCLRKIHAPREYDQLKL